MQTDTKIFHKVHGTGRVLSFAGTRPGAAGDWYVIEFDNGDVFQVHESTFIDRSRAKNIESEFNDFARMRYNLPIIRDQIYGADAPAANKHWLFTRATNVTSAGIVFGLPCDDTDYQ